MKNQAKIKKISLLFVLIVLALIAISSFIFAANEGLTTSISLNEKNEVLVNLKAEKNFKRIKLYKKTGDGRFLQFYQMNNTSGKEKTFLISRAKLSEESETQLKIEVEYEDRSKEVKDITLPKYVKPVVVSPNPTGTDPTASPNPTGTNPSASPNPTGTNPTSTPNPGNNTVTISTSKKTMMLDINHYNFTFFDVKVVPSTAKVTYSSSNTKIATVSSTGKIVAKGYGTAKITATAENNGAKASVVCNLRVIVPMTQKTSDSGAFRNYKENGATYRTYYIRYYNPTTKKINKKVNGKNVSQHWSDEEVEAYVNNAEWLVKNYPDKFGESKELTYYHYPNYGNPNKYVAVKKPKGELVTKGGKYIILFTTKNQCLYLLKKNSSGKWKLDTKIVSSGGYYWDLSKKDGVSNKVITYANGDAGLALHPHSQGKPATSKVGYTNAFHLGVVPGYPTSGGCTHIGNKITDPMAKRLKQVFVNEKQLIKVLYY